MVDKLQKIAKAPYGYEMIEHPVAPDIAEYVECGHPIGGVVPARLNDKGLELVSKSLIKSHDLVAMPNLVTDVTMPDRKARYRSSNIAWDSLAVGTALFFDETHTKQKLASLVSNRNKRGAEKYFLQSGIEYNGVKGSFIWRRE